MKTSRDLVVFFNRIQDSRLDLKSDVFADFSPHWYRKWNIGKIYELEDNDNMSTKLV
jgi:hypothetical protein